MDPLYAKVKGSVFNLVEASVMYHWLELQQVYFLSRQKFCRCKHVLVMTKHVFCHDKSMLAVTNIILLQQKFFCHDKYLS